MLKKVIMKILGKGWGRVERKKNNQQSAWLVMLMGVLVEAYTWNEWAENPLFSFITSFSFIHHYYYIFIFIQSLVFFVLCHRHFSIHQGLHRSPHVRRINLPYHTIPYHTVVCSFSCSVWHKCLKTRETAQLVHDFSDFFFLREFPAKKIFISVI